MNATQSAGRALLDALKAIDENAELRCRVQELEAERDALTQRIEDLEWNYMGKLPGVRRG